MAISGLYPKSASLYDRLKARVMEAELALQNVEQWITQPLAGRQSTLYASGKRLRHRLWEAPRAPTAIGYQSGIEDRRYRSSPHQLERLAAGR
jgi:hypothetical protein